MKITKLNHCALVVEMDGIKILTDPGMYSAEEQEKLTGIDAVIITHEHGDHCHADSVKTIVKNNPQATIITNAGVGRQLEALGVKYKKVDGRGKGAVKNVRVEAFDCRHEEIYEEWGQVQNTAYLMGGKLLLPGDAYCVPGVPVEVLALPVAGPWCRIPDAIRYGLNVKSAKAFPIHDGMFGKNQNSFIYRLVEQVYKKQGIDFMPLHAGGAAEF